MSEEIIPTFPAYQPPKPKPPVFAERNQSGPLMKIMKQMMKLPKRKVLQRRNRMGKKKYIIR
jgi:hypothetical protein